MTFEERPLQDLLKAKHLIEQETEYRDQIGPQFRAARKAAGLSVAQVAEVLGTSTSYVKQIENGARVPSASTATTFYNAYVTLTGGTNASQSSGAQDPSTAAQEASRT